MLHSLQSAQEMRLRFVIRGEKTANSNWAQGKREEAMNVFRRQTLHNAARSEALLASQIQNTDCLKHFKNIITGKQIQQLIHNLMRSVSG